MARSVKVSAVNAKEERDEEVIVSVVDEDRWLDQVQYLEDCGWEDVEEQETTDAADLNQDEFDNYFDLGRDN